MGARDAGVPIDSPDHSGSGLVAMNAAGEVTQIANQLTVSLAATPINTATTAN